MKYNDLEWKERSKGLKWPFNSMGIGEIIDFEDKSVQPVAQRRVHTYGHQAQKKFQTMTKDGILYIKRVS